MQISRLNIIISFLQLFTQLFRTFIPIIKHVMIRRKIRYLRVYRACCSVYQSPTVYYFVPRASLHVLQLLMCQTQPKRQTEKHKTRKDMSVCLFV